MPGLPSDLPRRGYRGGRLCLRRGYRTVGVVTGTCVRCAPWLRLRVRRVRQILLVASCTPNSCVSCTLRLPPCCASHPFLTMRGVVPSASPYRYSYQSIQPLHSSCQLQSILVTRRQSLRVSIATVRALSSWHEAALLRQPLLQCNIFLNEVRCHEAVRSYSYRKPTAAPSHHMLVGLSDV